MDGFSKYHFKDLGESEEIIKVVHRNWFYLLEQYFLIFLLAGIFYGLLNFAPLVFPEFLGRANTPVMLFAQNFFMLALWIYGFMIWVDYYFDIWIITSERIVNIEQKGLFVRRVSETTFDKIEDITTVVTGLLPTVINFGDVRVQTAAENEEFIFRTVSDPYAIKNLIIQMQKKSQADSTERLGEMIREKISA